MSEEFIFDSDDLITFRHEFESIEIESLTDSLLEVNLQDLNDRWFHAQKSYRALCTEKVLKPNKEVIEAARSKYRTCTKAFHACKSRILDLQKTFVSNSAEVSQPSSALGDAFAHVQVPPCDTNIFYGGYEEWPSFRDMFTAVYINNPRIPPVQKLYHLRLKAQGQAGSIIRNYSLCANNFSLAWDALRDRYENKRILVENQIKILLNLPLITVESSKALQKIQTTINDCLAALEAQNVPIGEWDPFIIILCSTKLPDETLSLWEQSLKSHRELVKWEQMNEFLSHRCEVVERLESRKTDSQNNSYRKETTFRKSRTEPITYSCKICNSAHPLKNCSQFLSLDPKARNQFVSNNKICLNCLAYTHMRKECPSKFSCSQCQGNHHSLLHFQKSTNSQTNTQTRDDIPETSAQARARGAIPTSTHTAQAESRPSIEETLLPTAIVRIQHQGDRFKARAFLDQGSERSFISRRLQQELMLPTENRHFEIHGIGGEIVANSKSLCKFPLYSEKYDRLVHIEAIVVSKITRMLPKSSLMKSDIPFTEIKDIDMADPGFYHSSQVDLLIGSNFLPQILLEGVRHIAGSLLGQWSIFGWVLSGPIKIQPVSSFAIQATEVSETTLSNQLKKFWEDEEVACQRPISKEDEYCESYYKETTFRNSDGRYVVRLPFKDDFPQKLRLGVSRSSAMAQYLNLEDSLRKKADLSETYHRSLQEYIKLDHIEPTVSSEIISSNGCSSFYLPHHAVFKPESRSTKVRVVFNASKKTSSGISLNDVLHVGPTLQVDLMSLILKWRLYQYVFNGDIEKMYRQIPVHMEDRQFQRILFRPVPNNPIKDFALKTITFGVNCAPYLAIRTLIQLAHDSESAYPIASHILKNETYVDDILSGAHDIQNATDALSQVVLVLKSAGFPLRKITSNCPEILASVPTENILHSDFLKFNEASITKTLGIQWNAISDCFSYTVTSFGPVSSITKRKILSHVAKLFDPAGWLSPIIIRAKLMLQQLWLEGTDWDENVKPDTLLTWNNFVKNLPLISTLQIPRWIHFSPNVRTQIHGFCDASERAYCAVIYFRLQSAMAIKTHLFVSKTKVAPINPVSLPRLELCGAALLSKLVKQLISSLPIKDFELFLWSDSSIVLSWLAKPPNTWKTYVANRTSQILRNVGNISWRHVRSADNPADLGSRGCDTDQLLCNSLWWHGPIWLQKVPEEWPMPITLKENTLEIKRKVEVFHVFAVDDGILNRFSKWDKAIRIMCYVFRFLEAIKKREKQHIETPLELSIMIKNCPHITHEEFSNTKYRLIYATQHTHYHKEVRSLHKDKTVGKRSCIYTLNPFLDENNIIRAHGRIANSLLPYNERFPIILPVDSTFCKLYIDFTHNILMHAGNNLMIRAIRAEYFVPRLRSAIRYYIRQCVVCTRFKQRMKSQLMGALPAERSTFSLPFTFTGLDFAGPFSIKTSFTRNAPYHKGYVCVFVCFCTRAIHLELCSDLTTNSFLAAFTRFVSRRGLPRKVMSDNGTNFVGADRALRSEYDGFLSAVSTDLLNKYSSHGFQWQFIPPNAPHMGGLWEAGVKSFKSHFKKVAQNHKYTFEEFTTLLTRIESVLNSRPLSPMSDDPNELLALTPGHFLRGAPLVALPEEPTKFVTFHDRWQRLKVLHHQFAQRWKDEYLKEIQKRYKWQTPEEDISIGRLVVVKDDLLPPNEWRLGRVMKTYFGKDGHVRVADVKTQIGTITRPIVKLCILPINVTENQ